MSFLAVGSTESDLDRRADRQRAGRPDGEAAAADVERERRGDGIAEPVGDGDAQHDARAGPAIGIVRKEMRHQRGHDVLHRHVLVDVAGDAQRPELADLIRVGDGPAEDHDRRRSWSIVAERAQHGHAVALRQPQIEHDEVDLGLARAHAAEQLWSVLRCDALCDPLLRSPL